MKKMTSREMYQEYKRLLEEKGMYKLDGIDTNSNKSMLQNGIDCLNCTDEMLNDYLIVLKLAYPNTYNKIANNGDFKKHSFNRLYVFNTARSILRG